MKTFLGQKPETPVPTIEEGFKRGLYISRYNGSVWIVTEPGVGTCIHMGTSVVSVGTHYNRGLSRELDWFESEVTIGNDDV